MPVTPRQRTVYRKVADDWLGTAEFVTTTGNTGASDFLIILHRSAIAHVYPAYRSYQAVQGGRVDELNNWLTYWGILGIFHTGEAIADSFVWWLPFYEETKILLVLWLAVPEGNGASYVYRGYLRPLMAQHQETIERTASQVRDGATSFMGGFLERVALYMQQLSVSEAGPASVDFVDIVNTSASSTGADDSSNSSSNSRKRI